MASTLPVSARISAMKARNQSSAMTFPSDLTTHGMLFMFSEYKFSATRPSSSPSVTSASRGSIILPLPMNMEDTLNIRIGTAELGNFGEIIAQGAEAAGNIQGSNAADIISGATGNVFGALQQMLPSGVDAAKFFSSSITLCTLATKLFILFSIITFPVAIMRLTHIVVVLPLKTKLH